MNLNYPPVVIAIVIVLSLIFPNRVLAQTKEEEEDESPNPPQLIV
jgi:hypothetical protein